MLRPSSRWRIRVFLKQDRSLKTRRGHGTELEKCSGAKRGLSMMDSQGLLTDIDRKTAFAGSRVKICSTMGSGKESNSVSPKACRCCGGGCSFASVSSLV